MSIFNSGFSTSELSDILEPVSPLCNQEDNFGEKETKQVVDIQETGVLQVGEARLVSKNLKRGKYTIKVRSTNGRHLNARILVQIRDNKHKQKETTNKTNNNNKTQENTEDNEEQILYQRNVGIKTSFFRSSSYTTDDLSIHQNSVMKVKLSNPSNTHPVNFAVELNGYFLVKRRHHSQRVRSNSKNSEKEKHSRSKSYHSRSNSFGRSLTVPGCSPHKDSPGSEEKKQQRRLQELSISPNHEARIPNPSENSTPNTPPDLPRRLKVRWIPREDGAVGRGGTSHVYMGVADDGRYIAIKQIHINDEVDSEKLQKEVELLRRCRHPHIVRYLGSSVGNDAQGKRYLTIFLEFIQGGSVHDILRKVGSLFEKVASNYTQQILYGLAYLHSQGIVHGDIKPSNVLVTHLQSTVKISDFGASRYLEDKVGDTTQGTPLYMSPEIVKGSPSTPESDIWALGCTVLEMITALPPWHECGFKNVFEAFRHIRTTTSPPHIPDCVSPPAADFIKECCKLNPENRPSAEELLCHPFIQEHEKWLNNHEEWIAEHKQQYQQIAPVTHNTYDSNETYDTVSSFEFTERSINATDWNQTENTESLEQTEDQDLEAHAAHDESFDDNCDPKQQQTDTSPQFHGPMQQEAFLDLDDNKLDIYPAAVTPQQEKRNSFTSNTEPIALFQDKEQDGAEDSAAEHTINDYCSDDEESVAISTSFGDSDGSDMGFEVISQGEVAAAQRQEKKEEPHHLISLFLRRNAQRQRQMCKSILGISSSSCEDILSHH